MDGKSLDIKAETYKAVFLTAEESGRLLSEVLTVFPQHYIRFYDRFKELLAPDVPP